MTVFRSITGVFGLIWNKLTQTKALADVSGDTEVMFLESIYRITYALGLSTVDNSSTLYGIYSTITKLLIAGFFFGESWFNVDQFENLGMDSIAASINVIAIHMSAMYKLKNMNDNMDLYKNLASSLESLDLSTDKRRRMLEDWAATNGRYLRLLLALGHCTLFAWHLYPLIDDVDYNLMVAVYIPYSYNRLLIYIPTYIIVGIAFLYISHMVMIADLTLMAYLVALVCQLTVLGDCFTNIVKDCSDEIHDDTFELAKNEVFANRYRKRLGHLIRQHNSILNSVMDLRVTLSGPLLCQLGASGVLICFIGYQAISTPIVGNEIKFLMSLFYLGYNMFELFIACRWCEEITIQSQNIGEAVYCSGWETGLFAIPGVKTSMVMLIARANKPLVFSAGGMYSLSLREFTSLVKTSYSALTMLLRFK